jgi:hypothetical protein
MADILDAVAAPDRIEAAVARVQADVLALCKRFPVYA